MDERMIEARNVALISRTREIRHFGCFEGSRADQVGRTRQLDENARQPPTDCRRKGCGVTQAEVEASRRTRAASSDPRQWRVCASRMKNPVGAPLHERPAAWSRTRSPARLRGMSAPRAPGSAANLANRPTPRLAAGPYCPRDGDCRSPASRLGESRIKPRYATGVDRDRYPARCPEEPVCPDP